MRLFLSKPRLGAPGFKLVATKEAQRLTGLDPSQLLRKPHTHRLTRIDQSGAREELIASPSTS
jgi:hypothetical protein